jgi:FAD/FMN-containing dehydrogenase/Fe-S oxidoreductase
MKKLTSNVDTAGLASELRSNVQGEVRFDDASRALYATDSSNYRQVPLGVVVPKSREDVIQTIAACRKFGAPVLSRGAGTSLAGQCCNVGVVIDWKKYLHNILELNPPERFARVEPGTVCDQVRQVAAPHGLTWGPDPATHTHCTFGGMLGNNSCGVHSQFAGKTVDNVVEMEVLLYDGTRMTVGSTDALELQAAIEQGGRIGEIFARLKALRERYSRLIEKHYPAIPRRVSGYNLDQLLPGPDGRFNLARALAGSESTCVTILEAKVQLIAYPAHRVLVVLGYPDIYQAADQVAEIVSFSPFGLEGFDDVTAGNIEKKGLFQREYLPLLPSGKGWLLAEFGADTPEEAAEHGLRVMRTLQNRSGFAARLYHDPGEQKKIWSLRESALGANSFVPGEAPTWEGWEDAAVAPEKLGGYLRDLQSLFGKYDYKSALYGHFGQGCVHNRVNFDLQSSDGIKKWRAFMDEATDLVISYGGSLSGEHGDGQARGEFLHKMFGPELIEAFREFKSLWDPDGKMNPGKLIDAYPIDENLRMRVEQRLPEPQTHFTFFSDSGSFVHAVGRCVGVGKCLRQEGDGSHDTMCPSYMVTREEKHSTRGRARLLWEMLRGEVLRDGWRDENVKQALDLCLACKGCKSDCPVNVDMATYKAEFLAHYWKGRLRPLHSYLFGWIDKWARLASAAPTITNGVTQLPLLGSLMKNVAGIHRNREIPRFASQTFRSWFHRRARHNQDRPKVLLWPDTFNNYFMPNTARAAVEVLEVAGYRVEIPRGHLCCGRPLYDHGFLGMAKSYLTRVLSSLREEIEAGTPLVVLEPSCCSVFRDEMVNLLPHVPAALKLSRNTFTLAEFLQKRATHYHPSPLNRTAIVQVHCHQKAVMGLAAEEDILREMQLDWRILESGCCGMAGAFGYEREKYDVSIACGERVLLPEVRKAEPSTLIVADGFSCREQIQQVTGRQTVHFAEVLRLALEGDRPSLAGTPAPSNE